MKLVPIGAACLFVTVSLQAQAWQRLMNGAAPSPRYVAMAHDMHRTRTMLVTAPDARVNLSVPIATWEWDGDRWLPRPTATVPTTSPNFDLTYDAGNRRMVLVTPNDETWAFDGVDWQLLGPAWPGTAQPRLAYDSARNVVVGYDNGLFVEWTGNGWVQPGGQSPISLGGLPVYGSGMAFHPASARIVLYGGRNFVQTDSRTFLWDGQTRTEATPSLVPPGRFGHRLVTDPVTGRVVLLGGSTYSGPGQSDVYEWDGSNWQSAPAMNAQRIEHAAAPHGSELLVYGGISAFTLGQTLLDLDRRIGSTFTATSFTSAGPLAAYDVARLRAVSVSGNRTLEFDGYRWVDTGITAPWNLRSLGWHGGTARIVAVDAFGGTFTYDGTAWTTATPAGATAAAVGAAMSYDPLRDRLVMFGGQVGPVGSNETWEWDGTAWTQRVPLTVPPASTAPAMCWRGLVGRTFLVSNGGAPTFEWDGVDWIPGPDAPFVFTPRVATDPLLDVVLVGTSSPVSPLDLTRVFDGGNWTVGPAGLAVGSPGPFLFDYIRGALISHDPSYANSQLLSLTPATAEPYGSGCAGINGTPRLAAVTRPGIGQSLVFDVLDAAGNAPVFLLASESTNDVTLPGGCTVLLADALIAGAATASLYGFASLTFEVPDSPSLFGLRLYQQALSLDATGPLLGFAALSQGLELRIGD